MGKKQGGRQNERPDRQLTVTSPKQWKKTDPEGVLVELPSGNVVRCKRPGMQKFVELGMVPNALIPIVDTALKDHLPPKIDDVINDQSLLEATNVFMDDVFLHCVVEPEVLPVPIPDEEGDVPEREEDVLYIDEVEMEDRVFVFQFSVGGTRSVQRFRQLQVTDMAVVAAEQLAEDEALGVAGAQ